MRFPILQNMVYKTASWCYNNHCEPPGPAGRLFDCEENGASRKDDS